VSWRTLVARIGVVIFTFGLVVLLFVAYQLWGTSITTRLHQDALRKQFERELAISRKDRPTTTTTSSPTQPGATTSTTQPLSNVAAPTPGVAPANGQPIGTIVIPAIGANFVVVQGTDTGDLELGPGHYANTPLPGQPGNAAIAGHRTTYLHPFYNLNELVAGDPIYITTIQGRFQYNVSAVTVVSPSDVNVLDATTTPTLTLTTCNPRYSASQRLVVQASLVSPPAPVPTTTTTVPGAPTKPARSDIPNSDLAGTNGSVWPTIGWGFAAAAFATTVWLSLRMWRRWPARVAISVVGALLFLTLLFFFFQSITPLLPASF
jgi:sortase A